MSLHIQNALRSGVTPEALLAQHAIKHRRHSRYPNLVLFKYDQIASDFSQPIVRECRGIERRAPECRRGPTPSVDAGRREGGSVSDIVAFAIAALAMAGLQAIPWVLLRRAEDRYCASLARWHAESVIREARYKAILRDFGTTRKRPTLPGAES